MSFSCPLRCKALCNDGFAVSLEHTASRVIDLLRISKYYKCTVHRIEIKGNLRSAHLGHCSSSFCNRLSSCFTMSWAASIENHLLCSSWSPVSVYARKAYRNSNKAVIHNKHSRN